MRAVDVQFNRLVDVPIAVWVVGRPDTEGAPSGKVNGVVTICILKDRGVWISVTVREAIEFIGC